MVDYKTYVNKIVTIYSIIIWRVIVYYVENVFSLEKTQYNTVYNLKTKVDKKE